MPLFEINGYTPLGTHFNVAFGLQSSETAEAFIWMLRQLRELAIQLGIPVNREMHVVITDDDTAMKNALVEIFPDAQQQLCIWHIEKNVWKNVKEKWILLPEDEPATLRPSDDTSPAGTGTSPTGTGTSPAGTEQQRPSRNQLAMEALLHDWKEITRAETPDDYSSKWAEFCSQWEPEQPGMYHVPSLKVSL